MIKVEIPAFDYIEIANNLSDSIKRKPGIYMFYGPDETLMYIGKTQDLFERIKNHLGGYAENTADVHHNFHSVACIFVESPVDREIYETYMINELKPLLNTNKVYTYKTSRYLDAYQSKEALEAQRRRQEEIDEAMRNFSI